MKKIYSLLFVSLFLFIGYSCDDGSLSHSDVYIPDPVEETDEDDGFSAEPYRCKSTAAMQPSAQ